MDKNWTVNLPMTECFPVQLSDKILILQKNPGASRLSSAFFRHEGQLTIIIGQLLGY